MSKSSLPISGSGDGVTIAFADKYAVSPQFNDLFREGMALVEDAAHYLDGPGRDASRALKGRVALAYSTESMRLTTQLMQVASWLLVRRSVGRGEMTMEQALNSRKRAKMLGTASSERSNEFDELPEKLKSLILECDAIYDRIVRLDRSLSSSGANRAVTDGDPLARQLDQIEAAFAAHKVR